MLSQRTKESISCPSSYIISFEGIDTAGKTTQLNLLQNFLVVEKKVEVRVFSEFSNFIVGNFISEQIIKNRFFALDSNIQMPFAETLLLISDHFVKHEFFTNHSRTAPITLADRHKDSLIAYQIPRIKNAHPNISENYLCEWLSACIEPVASPNLTFLLTLPIEEASARIYTRESYILTKYDKEFLEHVQSIFKGLVRGQPDRFCEIDASRSIDTIFSEIKEIVLRTLV